MPLLSLKQNCHNCVCVNKRAKPARCGAICEAVAALIDYSFLLSIGFAGALLFSTAMQLWLNARQARHVHAHSTAVPEAFQATVSLADHEKAAAYTLAKLRLGNWQIVFSAAILLAWTLLGGLSLLNAWLLDTMGAGMTQQLTLLVGVMLIGGVIDLPLSWWVTFKLEARFGFNNSTLKLWLSDLVKGAAMGLALMLPLAWAALSLMQATGAMWWLWVWLLWVGFNTVIMLVYPKWIAPRFNKFEPLTREDVKAEAMQLIERCGFEAEGLFVMDRSKRSAHANAYFTGLGKSKRVVFFDTLLNKLSIEEVKAVLAHELGHFHHKHIRQRLVMVFAMSAVALAVLSWLGTQVWFFTGLGVLPNLEGANHALALVLFMFAAPVVGFFVGPVMARGSRANEFEADRYATTHASADALASALTKLYTDNASTLTPDPLYSRFYASHPPAIERLAHIQQQATA
jgi:STE24 endopeptidase